MSIAVSSLNECRLGGGVLPEDNLFLHRPLFAGKFNFASALQSN